MSSELINEMIEVGVIRHAHFELDNVHTDNLVGDGFLFNYAIGDKINIAMYNLMKSMQFDGIIAIDNSSLIMTYPLSLMFKCNLGTNISGTKNITPESINILNKVVVVKTIIESISDLNNILKNIDVPFDHILCVTNYSGVSFIDGITINEIVKVNCWKPEDCPYCKDEI